MSEVPVTDLEPTLLAYGIRADAIERCVTERDDTFRVRAGDRTYALKIVEPGAEDAAISETMALEHIAAHDPSLPVPRVVRTVSGQRGHWCDGRLARLLTWMPGAPLSSQPSAVPDWRSIGAAVAKLGNALSGLDREPYRRAHEWTLQQLPHIVTEADDADVRRALRGLDALSLTEDRLPHGVIHGDLNTSNLLVDDRGHLVGIIDFGDLHWSARVVDLAIAISYVPEGNPLLVDELRAGYAEVRPLTDAERQALPSLVAARLAQRVVLHSRGIGRRPHDPRDELRSVDAIRPILRRAVRSAHGTTPIHEGEVAR